MSTPEALDALIAQLTQELDQVQQIAQHGLKITWEKLRATPDSTELTRLFAIFNNVSFFAENYRGRIQTTVKTISEANLEAERLQDAGEELAALLGVTLEAKMLVENSVRRLSKLS
ncbi:hypothetical protein [Synechococcus sp. PCC 7336]|uniref:hypothetical protein n=1 Tax=Synechococcus sp. PCC 7336 TaxID=195250 RepID=UPI00034A59EE|nr:hypothetical protein [Synechococcus sp. PCC 7336]